jgi:hypothetical protein
MVLNSPPQILKHEPSPEGKVELASNALYKKAMLVERGSFRPVTKVNIYILKCAGAPVHSRAQPCIKRDHCASENHHEQSTS